MSDVPMPSRHMIRGIQLKNLGRFADAESAFREALSHDPDDASALHELAACQFMQHERSEEALATIRRAIMLEPEESAHFALESLILTSLKRPKEALISARRALDCDPYSSFAFRAEAQAHIEMEQWTEAERSARQALLLDPDNTVAANQLVHALRLQNRMQENQAHLAGMLARDPENAWTHANAGWAALQQGQHRIAETHFREALRLDPELDSAREGLMNSFRARSGFYRAYLRYSFWMQRLSVGTRWAVILGLYFAQRLSAAAFTGKYREVAIVITAVYFVLVLWVWIAKGVGNFILFFDSFARHALRQNEKIEALMVGGGVACGALLVLLWAATGWPLAVIVGISLVAAAFPFSLTFTNPSRVGTWLFGILGGAMLLASFLVVAASIVTVVPMKFALSAFVSGLVGCLASTWLGNITALRR